MRTKTQIKNAEVREMARRGITENEFKIRKGLGTDPRTTRPGTPRKIDPMVADYRFNIFYRVGKEIKQSFINVDAEKVRQQFPEIESRVWYNLDLKQIKFITRHGTEIEIERMS